MRHDRSLGFDDLEARKLLSTAHHALTRHALAASLTPLVLSGTLTVDTRAVSSTMDPYGSTTTTTPVSGVLAGTGPVRGVWSSTHDMYGDDQGPDTIQLHNASGKLVIAFSDAKRGTPHKTASGVEYTGLPQLLEGGSGKYARTTEAGTLTLVSNKAESGVQSITVATGKE